jgi:hypothetical protein
VAAFCLPRSPLFEIARVLVYSDASLLKDQKLAFGDNQFLLEIESLNLPFILYFIHFHGTQRLRGLTSAKAIFPATPHGEIHPVVALHVDQ